MRYTSYLILFMLALPPALAQQQPGPSLAERYKGQMPRHIEDRIDEKFRAMDLNHDGFIDAKEIETEAKQQYQLAKKAEMESKVAIKSEMDLDEQQHIQSAVQKIMQADLNRDGKIHSQEFASWYKNYK